MVRLQGKLIPKKQFNSKFVDQEDGSWTNKYSVPEDFIPIKYHHFIQNYHVSKSLMGA